MAYKLTDEENVVGLPVRGAAAIGCLWRSASEAGGDAVGLRVAEMKAEVGWI